MPFSNVILQPDQLALARRVYDEIGGEPWFDRNRENEEALASMIVRELGHHIGDECSLLKRCEPIAKSRFSASPANPNNLPDAIRKGDS